MPAMVMLHEKDPKAELIKSIGSIDDIDVFNNQVLLAVYLRPEKTASGIYLTGNTRDEDKFQSKVGVILKMGPTAFLDETGVWFNDAHIHEGDWVVYRASDGWPVTVNKVLCRLMDDTAIKARVQHPDMVW